MSFDLQLKIPPTHSPLLLPNDRQRAATSRHNSLQHHHEQPLGPEDPLDNLEFLSSPAFGPARLDNDSDSDSDDESIEDFSLDDGNIKGVPSSTQRFDAKHYHEPEFATSLLHLLRDELRIPRWDSLPLDLPPNLLHIHKVSGALTNAVFFVSIPRAEFDVTPTSAFDPPAVQEDDVLATPVATQPTRLQSIAAELEQHRATPTTDNVKPQGDQSSFSSTAQKLTIEAPTLLLRVYGPSSGSLISRRNELHILHTLSGSYGIGPRVLGTFGNGRVEEYFKARAINKDEMRDQRISRCVGRRMRELHRVELEMIVLGPPERSASRDGAPKRPTLEHGAVRSSGGSGGSVYSTSSSSSVFSFGTSAYSTSSAGSDYSLNTTVGDSSVLGNPNALTHSPGLLPRRGSTESRAPPKRRSRSTMSSRTRRGGGKDKVGVWENITRWTREAKLVLKELDQLVALPGFSSFLHPPHGANATTPPAGKAASQEHVEPLSSPSLTLSLREELNLPLFEQQVKLYRSYVRNWEKQKGRSKRVFCHNDSQYGNLLLETPEEADKSGNVVIHCIDFEYSSANPRGFDIANHFIEWQADYHHPLLSHSLFVHGPYPTASERARFLRAYVGCDGGVDSSLPPPEPAVEDPRVPRLQEEVEVWEPASHAMWAVWGVVQAKEDLLIKVAKWKKACAKIEAKKQRKDAKGVQRLVNEVEGVDLEGRPSRPKMMRGKSGETIGSDDEEEGEDPPADFDYLSYALGRIRLFRLELKSLGITG